MEIANHVIIVFIIVRKVAAVDDSGKIFKTESVVPRKVPMRGSIGRLPKNGTFASLANSAPPFDENILVHCVQDGHT